jgi:hypothetical protein
MEYVEAHRHIIAAMPRLKGFMPLARHCQAGVITTGRRAATQFAALSQTANGDDDVGAA